MKIAVAMGAEVTVISTSDKKREEALGHLGAQHFLISKDEAAMKVRLYVPGCTAPLTPTATSSVAVSTEGIAWVVIL